MDNSRLLLFVVAASFDCVDKEMSFAERLRGFRLLNVFD